MEKENKNNGLWIISIVAIVAIVGLVFMFSENKVSYAPQGANYVYEAAQGDLSGQAVKRSLITEREIIVPPVEGPIKCRCKSPSGVWFWVECNGGHVDQCNAFITNSTYHGLTD